MRDSNPRSLRRLIYSQIPLAAWVTRQGAPARLFQSTGGAINNLTLCRAVLEIRPGSGADAVEVEPFSADGVRSSAPSNRHVAAATSIADCSTAPHSSSVDGRAAATSAATVAANAASPAPIVSTMRPGSVETGRVTTTLARLERRAGRALRREHRADAEVDEPVAQRVERLAVEQRGVVLADLHERGAGGEPLEAPHELGPVRAACPTADSGRSRAGTPASRERVGELARSAPASSNAEAADDDHRGIRHRRSLALAEPDATTLRRLVEDVLGLARCRCACSPRARSRAAEGVAISSTPKSAR